MTGCRSSRPRWRPRVSSASSGAAPARGRRHAAAARRRRRGLARGSADARLGHRGEAIGRPDASCNGLARRRGGPDARPSRRKPLAQAVQALDRGRVASPSDGGSAMRDQCCVALWGVVGYRGAAVENTRAGEARLLPPHLPGPTLSDAKAPLHQLRTSAPTRLRCNLTFRGLHEHSLDSKDRITVPSAYRGALSEGVVLIKGVEPCVEVWPAKAAEAMQARHALGAQPDEPRRPPDPAPLLRPLRVRRARLGRPGPAQRTADRARRPLRPLHRHRDGPQPRDLVARTQWLAEDEENEKLTPELTEAWLAAQRDAGQPEPELRW